MPQKARSKVSRDKIVEYWKDKIEINTTWDNALSHCWACGSNSYESLERAHIIPHCLNGIGDACNLVLLCSLCNCQCPETIFGHDFMLWLKSRVNQEEYYYLDSDNPLSIAKEYKNIYGKEMFKISRVNLFGYYFGVERYLNSFNKYRSKVEGKKMFSRYPATTAVMFKRYNNILMDAINYIVKEKIDENNKAKLLEIFYKFLKIKPEIIKEEIHITSNILTSSVSPLPQFPTLSILQEIIPIEEELIYGPMNKC
jgi:hypothetical protein